MIRSRLKKVALGLLIVFFVIQFVQPAHNTSEQVLATDFARVYQVPDSVGTILQNACYDCHSNNTRYPWYSWIQPGAWFMARHISKGKEKLNFSDFGNYSMRRQISKLKGIAGQIKEGEMPLWSYKLMHKNARLSQGEKELLLNWMLQKADSISASN